MENREKYFKEIGYDVELFRKRLEELSKDSDLWDKKNDHPDYSRLADICGSSDKTIRNWFIGKYKNDPTDIRSEGKDLNEKDFNPPRTVFLIKLADFFHVSLDYFLGRSDCRHPENENISKLIGLSDKSVEVLRYLMGEFHPEEIGDPRKYNAASVEVINFILEGSYEKVRHHMEKDPEDLWPITSFFSDLHLYLKYNPKDHIDPAEFIDIDNDEVTQSYPRGKVVEGFLERSLYDRLRKFREDYQKMLNASDSNNLG